MPRMTCVRVYAPVAMAWTIQVCLVVDVLVVLSCLNRRMHNPAQRDSTGCPLFRHRSVYTYYSMHTRLDASAEAQ